MFQNLPEAFSHLKDNVVGQIAEKVRDITNGVVSIDSILKGQVTIDANGYVDKVLNAVSEKLEATGITNIELPNHKMPFEKEFLCGLIFPGEVDFQNGLISGVTKLTRMDEASLKVDAFQDPIISVRAAVGIKEALANYIANIKFLCLNQDETKISGGLKDINLVIFLTVSRNFEVSMQEFDVKSAGSLTLGGLETLGIFETIKDNISNDVEQTIKNEVRAYLQRTIKNVTEDVIQSLPLKL